MKFTASPGRPAATTMDLFPVAEKHGQVSSRNPVSMDLFPLEEELSKMSDSRYIAKSLDLYKVLILFIDLGI